MREIDKLKFVEAFMKEGLWEEMGGVGLSYRVPVQIFRGTRLTYLDERAKLTTFKYPQGTRQRHKTHPKRSPSASKKLSQVTLPDSPTPPISTKRC